MPLYRMQTALQDVSGLARDEYVNSIWVHWAATPSPTAEDALQVAVQGFYDRLKVFLSPAIRTLGHTSKLYLHGAPLNSPPVRSWVWNFSSATGDPSHQAFPGEVAACLTFHGVPDPAVGEHPQSWRGRIYIGPLSATAAGSAISPGSARPDPAFTAAMVASGQTMADDIHAGAVLARWVVFSRKRNKAYHVQTIGCDDAWDTQRSRGLRPTHTNNALTSYTADPGFVPT